MNKDIWIKIPENLAGACRGDAINLTEIAYQTQKTIKKTGWIDVELEVLINLLRPVLEEALLEESQKNDKL